MADRILLESGLPDGILLEDSSGVLLLETAVSDGARIVKARRFRGSKRSTESVAAASSDIVAAGTLSITGAADLDAIGSLLAAGSLSISGVADLDARGRLDAAGSLSITGIADLDARGSLVAVGSLVINGVADLDAIGNLLAAGSVVINGAADLTGAALNALNAAGSLSITGVADLDATGSLLAAGSVVINGAADLTGSLNDISAIGSLSITGAADLDAIGQLLAAGSIVISGVADLSRGAVVAEVVTGGWIESAYEHRRAKLNDEIRRELEAEREREELADRLEKVLVQEGTLTQAQADLIRLRGVAAQYNRDDLPNRARRALAFAERAQSEFATKLALREIRRLEAEEEYAVLLLMVLD